MPPPPLPLVLSAAQCRVARALLKWTRNRLCNQAGLSRNTIAAFERGRRMPARRTFVGLARAFEEHGIRFLRPSDGSEAVQLLRPIHRPLQVIIPMTPGGKAILVDP